MWSALSAALDVVVGLRRRGLGHIDGVGTRKGLLQALIQSVVKPSLFGILVSIPGSFGVRA